MAMTFLLLYARHTAEGEWEREGPAMTFSDNLLRTGREQAVLYQVVG